MLSLPSYAVERTLHRGRDTILYAARRESDGQAVVIKVSARSAPTLHDRARLHWEYELLRELEQPGIVRAFALETSSRGPALVLEALPGQPLDAYLSTQRPSLRESLRIAIAITQAVAAVHGRGITHKDLKPHHIFYTHETGAVCLIDFGIAMRIEQGSRRDAGPSGLEGSLAYLSPEQSGRVNLPVDRRSDLYSLGVLFYELFTGVLPFSSVDPMDLLYCHIARRPLPPHVREVAIPETLSAIIMKLLSKAPEERYQSAAGLRADLLECQRQLEETGRIAADLRLATRDYPYELRLSNKLYGRERERGELLRIFEQVRTGAAGLVMVSGYSGVGKTALVSEVQKALMPHCGFFAGGKFEQLTRSTTYSSLSQALRELLQQVLAQAPDSVAQWREKLRSALGADAATVALLVPELRSLLGPLPDAPLLGPDESQSRFDTAAFALVRTFCQSGQPLVLLLDDLQWADPASLRLLRVLFGPGAPRGLLVIGVYRDNEVDAAHPLRLTLESLAAGGTALHEIKVGPLHQEDLRALLSDTLALPVAEVEELSRCVFAKTQGNPLFAGQFLSALFRDRLLTVSAQSGRWQWNIDELLRRAVTDNVIVFMAERVRLLPPVAQQVLGMAACIGHEFDLHTLAVICERASAELASALREPLREGMIVPLSAEHHAAALLDEKEPTVDGEAGAHGSYRFLHDQVHEAAHSLIAEEQRAAVRLRIGQLLLSRYETERGENPARGDDARLFDIVNHLNESSGLITAAAEQAALATLNRRAGERARAGAAFFNAAEYYRIGLELLAGPNAPVDRPLQLQLLLGAAESESLCGEFEVAESYFERIEALAPSDLELAHAVNLRLKLYQVAGRYREGVGLAERTLRLFDITLPRSAEEIQSAVAAEVADVEKNLAGREIEALIDAPLVQDPRVSAAIDLLVNATPCAYIGQSASFPLIALKLLNLSLRHGNTPASCFAYSGYGVLLVSGFGDISMGHRFSELAMRLNEKFHDVSLRGALLHLHGDRINFWTQHIRTDLPILERAFIACWEAGDSVYANYLAFETPWQLFEIGEALDDVLDGSERFAGFARQTHNDAVCETIRLEQQFFRALLGQTARPLTLDHPEFDEQKCRERIAQANFGCGIAFGHIIDLMLAYFRGELEASRRAIEAVQPYLGAVMAMPIEATFHFFRALTFAGSLSEESAAERTAAEREVWQQTLDADLKKLERWAAASPDTFAAKYLTARAEAKRRRGEVLEALIDYDAAIDAAQASNFPQYTGLAHELAGRCLRGALRTRPAALYLSSALRLYERWGAAALVAKVKRELEPLLAHLAHLEPERALSLAERTSETITSHEVTDRLLDVATVLKMAQTIASEIEMHRLLEQVMGIVLTNSGAQRGVLLISPQRDDVSEAETAQPGELTIAALALGDPPTTRVKLALPLASHGHEAPASVVGLVANTRETLFVSNAHEDPRFAADPYIKEQRPRSLLSMPLLHQNQLSGVLYLENGVVRDAFSRERMELLRLLCAQVASSLDNARLYERLRSTSAALHATNARLEAEVAARTADLHEANRHLMRRGDELDETNRQLQRELTERQRAEQERQRVEQERAALQTEIIRTQQARLTEMATPLIPISKDIVVMPLIGSLDHERAQQMLETVLKGVEESHARFVILDVTGLRHVDTSVAGTLMNTARALQLVGARAVITGIRAEVAQTLVSLGVDLRGIVSLSQLQNGIAYALRQLERSRLS